jgi:transcriptional regulator with XRE-family HTH domain
MTEQLQTADGTVIKWDQPDRMRKALRVSGVSVQEMADYLDVDRSTVSTWINGRIKPSVATLRLWALRTGVPFTWLHHGDLQPCDLNPVDITAGQDTHGRRATSMQRLQTYEVA